jgi:hypothetical protein
MRYTFQVLSPCCSLWKANKPEVMPSEVNERGRTNRCYFLAGRLLLAPFCAVKNTALFNSSFSSKKEKHEEIFAKS